MFNDSECEYAVDYFIALVVLMQVYNSFVEYSVVIGQVVEIIFAQRPMYMPGVHTLLITILDQDLHAFSASD